MMMMMMTKTKTIGQITATDDLTLCTGNDEKRTNVSNICTKGPKHVYIALHYFTLWVVSLKPYTHHPITLCTYVCMFVYKYVYAYYKRTHTLPFLLKMLPDFVLVVKFTGNNNKLQCFVNKINVQYAHSYGGIYFVVFIDVESLNGLW